MKKEIELSIIIVNYNTPALTKTCIDRVIQSKPLSAAWEIIVIDNGSTDDSVNNLFAYDKEIILIKNSKNAGFAVANNQGIKQSTGTYILLLNSDTEVEKDSLQHMVQFLNEHTEYAAATCKVILPNGVVDPASHRGFPTPWAAFTYFSGLEKLFPHIKLFSQYHQWYKNLHMIHDIDSPSGAFFLVRRSVIDDIGLLDEEYFMYAEDIDWAYRMREKGYRIAFNPHATILHRKKQSGRSHQNQSQRKITRTYFYTTMRQFYHKHYEKKYPWMITVMIDQSIKFLLFLNKR